MFSPAPHAPAFLPSPSAWESCCPPVPPSAPPQCFSRRLPVLPPCYSLRPVFSQSRASRCKGQFSCPSAQIPHASPRCFCVVAPATSAAFPACSSSCPSCSLLPQNLSPLIAFSFFCWSIPMYLLVMLGSLCPKTSCTITISPPVSMYSQ